MVLKEGVCDKRSVSAVLFKNWKVRRIVLTATNMYQIDQRATQIEWHAPIYDRGVTGWVRRGVLAVNVSTAVVPVGDHVLAVRSEGRELLLRMKTVRMRENWLVAIRCAIAGEPVPEQQVCGTRTPMSLSAPVSPRSSRKLGLENAGMKPLAFELSLVNEEGYSTRNKQWSQSDSIPDESTDVSRSI